MKNLLLLAMLALAGCASNRLQTGTYKVATVKKFNGQSVVHFQGYKGEYIFPTDSLKKDDYVFITIAGGQTANRISNK